MCVNAFVKSRVVSLRRFSHGRYYVVLLQLSTADRLGAVRPAIYLDFFYESPKTQRFSYSLLETRRQEICKRSLSPTFQHHLVVALEIVTLSLCQSSTTTFDNIFLTTTRLSRCFYVYTVAMKFQRYCFFGFVHFCDFLRISIRVCGRKYIYMYRCLKILDTL